MITTESVIIEPEPAVEATPSVVEVAETAAKETPSFIVEVEDFLDRCKKGLINSTEESLKHINALLTELKARL